MSHPLDVKAPDGGQVWECPECSGLFSSEERCKDHMHKRHDLGMPDEYDPDADPGPDVFSLGEQA